MLEQRLVVAPPLALRLPRRLAGSDLAARAAEALRLALPPYLLSRLALFVVAGAAVAVLGTLRVQDPQYPAPLQAWLSWDAVHYLRLAVAGYPTDPRAVDAGYFPLLPAVLHVTGASPLTAVVVAFALGLGAVAVLAGLTAEILGPVAARRTAWVACWWPEAFVLSAVVTEGPFLLVAAGACWAAWRRHVALAAVLGATAALLRPTGLLIALPLVVLLPAGRARLAALAPPAAAAGFAGFLWVHTGTPLAYMVSQSANHPVHAGVFALADLGRRRPDDLLGVGGLLLVLMLAVRLASMRELERWRVPALLLVAALLVPPLSSGTLGSYGRYAAVAFPLFWAASTLRLRSLAPVAVPAALLVTVACATGHVTP